MIKLAIFSIIFGLGLLGLCCYGIYANISVKKETEQNYKTQVQNTENQISSALEYHLPKMKNNYYELKSTVKIPFDCPLVDMTTTVFGLPCEAQATGGKLYNLLNDFYMWKDENYLYLFPTEKHLEKEHITYRTLPKDLRAKLIDTDISLIKIPIRKIEYYKIQGDERRETKILSANNGINVKGAVVGGLLAGDAGAAIGSQYGKNIITSNTHHFDERICEVLYKEDSEVKKIKLSITAYEHLEKWFPNKEFTYVTTQVQNKPVDSFEEIKKYKELLDSGIISTEEFEAKKKELLNL